MVAGMVNTLQTLACSRQITGSSNGWATRTPGPPPASTSPEDLKQKENPMIYTLVRPFGDPAMNKLASWVGEMMTASEGDGCQARPLA